MTASAAGTSCSDAVPTLSSRSSVLLIIGLYLLLAD
jgi:hypothetical protein